MSERTRLPAHCPTCFGCGPESYSGLRVVCFQHDQQVHASYTFGQQHAGMPGIVHGGLVATLVDDVCAGLLFVVKRPAVIRTLNVEYLKPVRVGIQYDLIAEVQRAEGRKLFITCEGRSPQGELTFTRGGLFLVVAPSHFAQSGGAVAL